MAFTVLSPSGLRTTPTGDSTWLVNAEYNFARLNTTLLKLLALQDVTSAGITTGDLLRYNTSTVKWEPWTPPWAALPTTTTA